MPQQRITFVLRPGSEHDRDILPPRNLGMIPRTSTTNNIRSEARFQTWLFATSEPGYDNLFVWHTTMPQQRITFVLRPGSEHDRDILPPRNLGMIPRTSTTNNIRSEARFQTWLFATSEPGYYNLFVWHTTVPQQRI